MSRRKRLKRRKTIKFRGQRDKKEDVEMKDEKLKLLFLVQQGERLTEREM